MAKTKGIIRTLIYINYKLCIYYSLILLVVVKLFSLSYIFQ